MTYSCTRRISLATTIVLTLGFAFLVGSGGLGSPASADARWKLTDRFAREVVRPGDVDRGPFHIEHVYEAQYRLKRLGLFKGHLNGHFRSSTRAAVIAFQKRNGLPETGTVGERTWKPLIRKTIRARGLIPKRCHSAGWHACYDRLRHQLALFHDGRLRNAWMVRGGYARAQTRLGAFRVFYRDAHHRSNLFKNAPMPYAQFFSGGEAIHGSRHMVNPFKGHSHGCINMWVEDARQLWRLTSRRSLTVHVYGRWS